MAEYIVEKTLTVTGIGVTTELATGDFVYQVSFGYYAKTTPEILSRIPPNMREMYSASKSIVINEFSLFIKTDEVPYKTGSKWKLRIRKNGTLNLVESK
jgi:hypothetical protein